MGGGKNCVHAKNRTRRRAEGVVGNWGDRASEAAVGVLNPFSFFLTFFSRSETQAASSRRKQARILDCLNIGWRVGERMPSRGKAGRGVVSSLFPPILSYINSGKAPPRREREGGLKREGKAQSSISFLFFHCFVWEREKRGTVEEATPEREERKRQRADTQAPCVLSREQGKRGNEGKERRVRHRQSIEKKQIE